jgi:hypothetical protein
MRRHPLPVCILITFLFALITACQTSTPTPPPVEEIIDRSASYMKSLAGFSFLIDRQGAPAFLDYEETLAFRRTEGVFTAPDRAQATVRVIGPGVVAEVKIIGIGADYWETNLLSGEWQYIPGGLGFNPAVLFDPQIGFQPILESDLSELVLTGLEELQEMPGMKLYAITGRLQGERIYQMSYEMIGPEPMDVKLWIAPQSYELHRIFITDPNEGGDESTTWQVDFWNFGTTVEIVPPPTSETQP